jgi:hypothetical protein
VPPVPPVGQAVRPGGRDFSPDFRYAPRRGGPAAPAKPAGGCPLLSLDRGTRRAQVRQGRVDSCSTFLAGSDALSQFLLGCVVLLCLWQLLKPGSLSKSPVLDGILRRSGSFVAFALAIFTLTRGELGLAIPLFILAAGLRGWLPQISRGGFSRPRTRTAFVRTTFVTVMLDPMRQPVDGQITRGRFAGRKLSDLQPGELLALRHEVAADFFGRSILEAYLDRRLAGWREHFQDDAAAGRRDRASSDAMSKQEAYEILGVQPGAGADDIRRAHRTLMKKIHPDKGGTTQMAARVNQARDILLEGH